MIDEKPKAKFSDEELLAIVLEHLAGAGDGSRREDFIKSICRECGSSSGIACYCMRDD
jgi:hypothetical protein